MAFVQEYHPEMRRVESTSLKPQNEELYSSPWPRGSCPELVYLMSPISQSVADSTGSLLSEYAERAWPDGIVRLVRGRASGSGGGSGKARVVGARAARGDVIVFIDAHCEVNRGW